MTVRVGFLGAGLIATAHAISLQRSGAPVAFAGVFDPDSGRAASFAGATGATPVASEEAVIDGCDGVYVCTWTAEHRHLVEAAAAAGRAVFCEKPLATDLAGARAMAQAVDAAGVVNQVGLILRRSPAFSLARALVHEPASGRPMAVVFRDDQYIPTQGMYASTWRGDAALAGAGTLIEHSIHDVDLLEHVVAPITSVSARTSEFHGLDGIEDAVALTIGFAGGAVGTLVSVWHDMLERPNMRRLEVLCESAWICLENDWSGPVRWRRAGDADGERAVEGEALAAEAARRDLPTGNPDAAFVDAVAAGTPTWPSVRDAVRAHEVVDAAYRSAAAGGGTVDVPPPLPIA
jgi:predicted dehydrogenase